MNKISLDNPELFKQLDSAGMLTHLYDMPALCRQAWQMAMDFRLPESYSRVNKVVILGMGGSAIGGDLASSLAATEAKLPVFVCRDYNLPGFVDARTLVIASSYSGMTEETLSAFGQALKTGAKKLAITTGGSLEAIAEKERIPLFLFDYKSPPRAALPFSFLAILGILQKLGFVPDKTADVEETVKTLEKLARKINENVPDDQNPAKQLAYKLDGKIPVVYGAGILSEVARRWKTQFNENSKSWAFFEVLPELNHNAVVGYQFPKTQIEDPDMPPYELPGFAPLVVFLRSRLLHPRTLIRYEITQQMLHQAKVDYQTVEAEGTSALSQMLSLVLFGDYVSYYLALLYQVEPAPVKVIDFLKSELSRR